MFKYALFKKKHLQPSVISVYLNDKEFTLKFSSNFLSIYQYFFSACEVKELKISEYFLFIRCLM